MSQRSTVALVIPRLGRTALALTAPPVLNELGSEKEVANQFRRGTRGAHHRDVLAWPLAMGPGTRISAILPPRRLKALLIANVTRKSAMTALGAAALLVSAVLTATSATAATPTCFGKTATHVMQPGEGTYYTRVGKVDVVVGTFGPDSILGPGETGPATDVGDYLCGGPGNDYIEGGAGPDHINGGDGDDRVAGWRGADIVQGNAGNDMLDEGSMDSQDAASDILRGGIGNDVLYAGWGRDKAYGEGGSDQLFDTECDGPTVLNGGPGSDYLESWSSSYEGWHGNVCTAVGDQIVGGTGTDTAQVDRLDSVSTVEKVRRITQPTG